LRIAALTRVASMSSLIASGRVAASATASTPKPRRTDPAQ
jgi:hypothetical protein